MTIYLVVPALKVAGGILEACALAGEIAAAPAETRILSMWAAEHPVETGTPIDLLSSWRPRPRRAAFQLPILLAFFRAHLAARRHGGDHRGDRYVFTHYSTFPLAAGLLAHQRLFFVQDLEWEFLAHPLARRVLRRYILANYRHGRNIAANSYLATALRDLGCGEPILAPIWADSVFRSPGAPRRDVDFVMVLRKGAHKRLDLYLEFIALAKRHGGLRLAAISPEADILEMARGQVDVALLRPSREEMRNLFARSSIFVHLSEHEGFGLPPLEAMGAGCVPLCRDSGGVRAYMDNDHLKDGLLPLQMPIDALFNQACAWLSEPATMADREVQARRVFEHGIDTASARHKAVRAIVSE